MADDGSRDEQWFIETYERFHAEVSRYCYRRLRDRERADELTQEVFVIAWRRRDDVPAAELPWLYGVARRVLANEWRGERRRPAASGGEPSSAVCVVESTTDVVADMVVTVVDVSRALATLSADDQEILRLIGWEQVTVREAALVLGCTPATAAVRLFRARRRLKSAMDDRPRVRAGGRHSLQLGAGSEGVPSDAHG